MVSFPTQRPNIRQPLTAAIGLTLAAIVSSLSVHPAAAFGLGSLSEVDKTLSAAQSPPKVLKDGAAGAKKMDGTLPAPDATAQMPKPAADAATAPSAATPAPLVPPAATASQTPAQVAAPAKAAPVAQPMPQPMNAAAAPSAASLQAPVATPSAAAASMPAAPGAQPMPQPMNAAAAPATANAPKTPAAAAPANAAAGKQALKPAIPADPTKDYYAERAKQVLADEKKGTIKLHPLQLAAPEYDVTLCEAGCKSGGTQILSKELKSKAVSADGRALPKDDAAPIVQGAECVGGCKHDEMAMMNTSAAGSTTPRVMGEQAGTWMTSVARDKPAMSKPAAKKASAEDWMARINRERVEKPAQSEMPAPAANQNPAAPKS